MKVRALIKLIESDGWVQQRQRGSHRHFTHALKPGGVTIAGSLGDEVRAGTLAAVLRQAGLKGQA